MGRPEKEAVVRALVLASASKVLKVELLGSRCERRWKQDENALKVEMPMEKISEVGFTLKMDLA
jgi:hypothetical protein